MNTTENLQSDTELSIGQVAEMTSISIDTLRFYEKTGVIPNVQRNASGRRIYNQYDVNWLNFVNCLKTTGMPLDKIREYLNLMNQGDHTTLARRDIIANYKQELQEKIDELNTAMDHLNKKLNYYDEYIANYNLD